MNLRPSGYEPDELPGCSTPRYPIFPTGKISLFLPEQIAEGDLSPLGDAPKVCPVIDSSAKQKGRFVGGPWVSARGRCFRLRRLSCVLQTWQRPTLPRLETKYHWRWGVSRPCSEWERVQPPRNDHQVSEAQHLRSWFTLRVIVFEHV